MGLSKIQYEAILRDYEKKQINNFHLKEKRLEEIYQLLPRYKELDDLIAETSISHTRLLLDGNDTVLTSVKNKLHQISEEKRSLLLASSFPSDYLDPIYTCSICKDTGFVNGVKCSCFRQLELTYLYEQSNIQETIKRENFSTLSYEYYTGNDLKHFENAVLVSKNFVSNFHNSYQNLFFYGTVGTGKSFLSGCIAKELLADGVSVIYFSTNGLFETLSRYSFGTNEKESLYNFNKDLYNCNLVIIDDLGTEVTNNFVTSQLFGILNERHLRQKSTIISTNLNLEELRDRYSERIFSRITSNYHICKFTGQDIRMYKKISSNQRK